MRAMDLPHSGKVHEGYGKSGAKAIVKIAPMVKNTYQASYIYIYIYVCTHPNATHPTPTAEGGEGGLQLGWGWGGRSWGVFMGQVPCPDGYPPHPHGIGTLGGWIPY